MEAAFGTDFAEVRVHAGGMVGSAARRRRAAAFTLGTDIGFAPGRYAPGTTAGHHLPAHELAHVLQQRRGGPAAGAANTGVLEQQAGRAAQEAATGRRVQTPLSPAPAGAQHSPEGEEGGRPTASKPAAKIPLVKIPTPVGEFSVQIAVSPAGAGKDPRVPTRLAPNIETEIRGKVALKLKRDVLRFPVKELPHRLGALGFTGMLSTEFLEGELKDGVPALNVVTIKGEYQSTDTARFGAHVGLEFQLKAKPEDLLWGKERARCTQFRKVSGDLEKSAERLTRAGERLRKAEQELAEVRAQVKRLGQRYRGRPPRGVEKAMLRELKADMARLEQGVAGRKRTIKELARRVKAEKRLLRRLSGKAIQLARTSKNPVFRALMNAAAKKIAMRLVRFIPVLAALGLAYDVIVVARNLVKGRLRLGPGPEGDPWGEGVGDSATRPDADRPVKADAQQDAGTGGDRAADAGTGGKRPPDGGRPASQATERAPKAAADRGTEVKPATDGGTVDGGTTGEQIEADRGTDAGDRGAPAGPSGDEVAGRAGRGRRGAAVVSWRHGPNDVRRRRHEGRRRPPNGERRRGARPEEGRKEEGKRKEGQREEGQPEEGRRRYPTIGQQGLRTCDRRRDLVDPAARLRPGEPGRGGALRQGQVVLAGLDRRVPEQEHEEDVRGGGRHATRAVRQRGDPRRGEEQVRVAVRGR
jgi:hypothetical protein